ncbi:MAG: dehydrogenases with different specificities (related to short-chain alcohol dehydrogenases) [Parcubacteria group bacterium Greene0416_79]|nr:MAG: dehydrogenases with different specificities (related to short-chain alcohol dehydrogenases) [Parcubacteria group bacterium Greene0416_79]
MRLQRVKTIITGASGGIGRVITFRFLREGALVLAVARNSEDLSELRTAAQNEGSSLTTHAADVSRMSDVASLMEATHRLWNGGTEVLINAAGIYGPKNVLEKTSPEAWLKTIMVNLYGTMLMTRAVLPNMKKQKKGTVINFSGGGEGAFPRFSAYAASKGGIVRFTESVAEEVKEYGITMNAIAPGAVNSRLLDEALLAGRGKVGEATYQKLLKQKEEGGVSPERAAELCVFLASSGQFTGKVWSAVWDDVKSAKRHAKDIMATDIYTYRRIKPSDRGYDWK